MATAKQKAGSVTPSVAVDPAVGGKTLLDLIVAKDTAADAASTKPGPDPNQLKQAKTLRSNFVKEILKNDKYKDNPVAAVQKAIQQIDEVLSAQLNEILHHADFKALEASWRGLHYLVTNTETGIGLKLRLLCASKKEIEDDLEKAADFDQSALFKKIYEEEYGTFGGKPFSVLLGAYEFDRSSTDLAALPKIAGLAAAAHAPFIAAADPKLFNGAWDSFQDLGKPRDLAKIFENTELAAWTSFREMEDSRYVTLVMPRVLLRLPYGPDFARTDGIELKEDTDGRDHKKYLWGNAAWALGLRITTAYAQYGWCAAIRGVEGGGKVSGLPNHTFNTDEGDKAQKCPTEIAITDRREKELDTLGFVALLHCKNTDYAAFFSGQTTQKPKKYDTSKANDNASISARLPYIINASRFAHYLKVMCRDKVGSFQTKETMSVYLNRWISRYVLGTDDAGQELKAQYPLREARVDVFDVTGRPGVYRAVVFLRPHFQLEELTASIRLVAELPPPAAA